MILQRAGWHRPVSPIRLTLKYFILLLFCASFLSFDSQNCVILIKMLDLNLDLGGGVFSKLNDKSSILYIFIRFLTWRDQVLLFAIAMSAFCSTHPSSHSHPSQYNDAIVLFKLFALSPTYYENFDIDSFTLLTPVGPQLFS